LPEKRGKEMRLFIGLIIIGVALLSASFYLGARFFDGKVDEDTYSTALRYDEQNHLIKNTILLLKKQNSIFRQQSKH